MLNTANNHAERRRAKRVPLEMRTRFRYTGFQQGDLVIRDLSFTGCRCETDVQLNTGDLVSVALPNIGLVRASVQWCSGGKFAAQFQKAVDIRACFR